MLLDEHALVVERLNAADVTLATLIKLAISANLSKDGGKIWIDQIDSLSHVTVAKRVGAATNGEKG